MSQASLQLVNLFTSQLVNSAELGSTPVQGRLITYFPFTTSPHTSPLNPHATRTTQCTTRLPVNSIQSIALNSNKLTTFLATTPIPNYFTMKKYKFNHQKYTLGFHHFKKEEFSIFDVHHHYINKTEKETMFKFYKKVSLEIFYKKLWYYYDVQFQLK